MRKCKRCGNSFDPEDAKSRLRDHLIYLGWERYLGSKFREFYDKDLCEFCVCDNVTDEGGGEYRTYEEYQASGGPVDPCDDALWLNDQA